MAKSGTNMIEGAKPIMEALHSICKDARIVAGEVKSNIGAHCFAVKLKPAGDMKKVTVITRGEKQDFHVRGGPSLDEIANHFWANDSIRRRYIIQAN